MTPRPITIETYTDDTGQVRIRIKAGNGRILLSSEAYEKPAGADNAIEVLVRSIRHGNYRRTRR